MPLIAITGGIAAGKSTFTRLLADALDAATFDTDHCARRLLSEDREVAQAVRTEFGGGVFDAQGRIERAVLRQIVFAASESRGRLEAILHPRVRAAWTGWARERLQKAPDAILLVEIPLLYETAAASLFDQAVTVGCTEQTQVRRLTIERHLPIDIARRIIASQWSMAEKIRLGDRLIWNDGASKYLQAQADLCAQHYRDSFQPQDADG